MKKQDIKSMTLAELTASFGEIGLPAFRARQVFKWLQVSGVTDFDQMTDLSKSLRGNLAEKFQIYSVQMEKRLESKRDNTVKYLYKLFDGEYIESVLMEHSYGFTLCISTQVGCRMGCSFCASTLQGLTRNLTPSEMLSQIHAAQADHGIRISHVVLMGMGEPLDNFENTIRFLQLVSDEGGLNLGMRHITLSTCGLVDKIYRLLQYHFQLTLSISLHAPNGNIRSRIMPVNRKWDFEELLEACRVYVRETSRRISFEYAMIAGVNDSDDCADELAERLQGILCHVNLIPANEVRENEYKRSSRQRLKAFQDRLTARGINATVRISMGGDIDASCGQLRQKALETEQR